MGGGGTGGTRCHTPQSVTCTGKARKGEGRGGGGRGGARNHCVTHGRLFVGPRDSHPYTVETEHNGFSPTRQTTNIHCEHKGKEGEEGERRYATSQCKMYGREGGGKGGGARHAHNSSTAGHLHTHYKRAFYKATLVIFLLSYLGPKRA